MNPFNWVFGSNKDLGDSELPEIFPLALNQDTFIKSDILTTYLKILTDTFERTHGLNAELHPLLWDNCVQNEASQGLVSLLADAMTNQADLFLVYVPSVKVVRKATQAEESAIRADYTKTGESKVGVYISFKKYHRTEMLRIYSSFEYCILASLHKTLNISKAVQLKVKGLRASVSLSDSAVAKAQAQSIAKALKNGNDVLIDVGDEITTATPDTAPTEKAISFLDAKRAFILGLPMAYVTGEQTGGIGSSGENDMRAVERGLKQYFTAIVQPVLKVLFKADALEFKSQDFRTMTTALEALKTFDLVSNENLSTEAKQEILARLFDLDPEEEQANLEAEAEQRAEDAANAPKPAAPPAPEMAPGNGASKRPQGSAAFRPEGQ